MAHWGRIGIALATLTCLLSARPARAGDPSLVWHTLESPHFYVHYYDPHYAAAYRVTRLAERAHEQVSPILDWEPPERVHIVLTDDTDSPNGSASVLPYDVITLYLTGPEPDDELNQVDDFLADIITHEYTHILHLGNISGFPAVVNSVFGRQWSPNHVVPRWMIEGIAAYSETARTTVGRASNTFFDAILRTQLADGIFQPIDEVSNGSIHYPRGSAVYLYGSHFFSYLADRFGDDAIARFAADYGGSIIPFAINREARRIFGKTFVDLWADWKQHLGRKFDVQLEAVRARGVREGRRLTTTAEVNQFPRYSPDGKRILWAESTGWDSPRYRSLDVAGGHTRTLLEDVGSARFSMLPDGSGSFVYERTAPYQNVYYYEDLYLWDAAREQRRRLTFGARASDPDVSPDGTRVVFAMNGGGVRRLAMLRLDQPGAKPEVLITPAHYEQIYTPVFSPDGRQVAYSQWKQGGYRDIHLYDLDTGQVRELMHDRAMDQDPRFSADGRTLYYSSDQSGIPNIYAFELATGRVKQVTNVIGAAYQPAPSPDGKHLVYVRYGSRGGDLAEIDLDPAGLLEPVTYVTERVDADNLPFDRPGSDPQISKPRDYDPSQTILPRSWTAKLGRDAWGRALAIGTSGGDVIGRHQYAIDAQVGTQGGHLQGGFFYAYNRLFPRLELSAREAVFQTGVREDTKGATIDIEYSAVETTLRLPLALDPAWGVYGTASLGWERYHDLSSAKEASLNVLDPGELRPRRPLLGLRGNTSLGWLFNSARGYAETLGAEQGRTLALNLGVISRNLGSAVDVVTFTWTWNEFFQLPWHGGGSLRYQGGLSSNRGSPTAAFGLGGLVDEPVDQIIRALITNRRLGPPALHGYPGGLIFGDQYHLLNADWRFPIWELYRGPWTYPVYLARMSGALYADLGGAFFGPFHVDKLKSAVGGELHQDIVLGWYLPATVVVGLARGLNAGGVTDFYTYLSFPL